MASIRRGTIVRDIIDSLKLQVAGVMPDQTSDKLVLTYDFSNVRSCNVFKYNSRATTGASTIYTTPATEDFFLTGVSFTVTKDATSDGVLAYVTANINSGETARIAQLYMQTTTAGTHQIVLNFPIPIKIDRNTAIAMTQSFTAGAQTMASQVIGYTVSG